MASRSCETSFVEERRNDNGGENDNQNSSNIEEIRNDNGNVNDNQSHSSIEEIRNDNGNVNDNQSHSSIEEIRNDNGNVNDNQSHSSIEEIRNDNGNVNDNQSHSSNENSSKKHGKYIKRTKLLQCRLKFHFFSAFKCKSNKCHFHPIQVGHLLLQVTKLVFITMQIYFLGTDRRYFSDLVNRGSRTLRHLMLEDWDASREVPPYPPSQGEFAVYSIPKIESKINYAVAGYYNARHEALGYYVRMPDDKITLELKYFSFQGFDDPGNDIDIHDDAIHPSFGLSETSSVYTYNISHELASLNITQPFKRLLDMWIHFQLHSVRIFEKNNAASCMRIQGYILFEDLDNNGQAVVDLDTVTYSIPCSSMNISANDWIFEHRRKDVGKAVIGVSALSATLTIINIFFSFFLIYKTNKYMKKNFKAFYNLDGGNETNLSCAQYFKFLKLWDVCQLVGDILTLVESVNINCLLFFEPNGWVLSDIDTHTVLLSVGGLLSWISFLRFFKFNNKFHLLFSTLYKAAFDVLAYLLCISVLFVGFWGCGYVVLSPYHVKFKTVSASAETLLSIVTGDEIFATLAILEYNKSGSNVVWWFLRFYIMTYVSIFTIVAINLLIAIFTSAYESIRIRSKTNGLEIKKGPIEEAIIKLMKTTDPISELRNQFLKLMKTEIAVYTEPELELRRQLKKLVTVTDDNKVVELKPRTIKALIDDYQKDSEDSSCRCVCFNPCKKK